MNKYRNLATNIALFTINAVATKLITFILVPLYTYYMSAAEYGLTDMSVTVISLITPLVTLDIADSAVRFIIGDRAKSSEYAAISLVLTVASIVIVAILSPVFDLAVFGGLGNYKGWFILAYSTSAIMAICGQIARGMSYIKLIPLCAAVSSIITLVLALLLIGAEGLGVPGYFASVSIGPAVASTIYLVFGGIGSSAIAGIHKIIRLKKTEIYSIAKPMFHYSLPLIPNCLFWWIGSGINRFFITGMLGIAASGMFAAASKIPNLLNAIYAIFQQAWQLSAFQEAQDKGLSHFFSSIFSLLQAAMSILCAVMCFTSPWLALIFLQGETYEAWPMMGVLLLSNLFNIYSSFYGSVYATTMQTSFIMKTTVFGALSCIILTPILIPFMGIFGASVASCVGQALVFVARAIDSKKYMNIDMEMRALIITLFTLFFQAISTAIQFPFWQLISGLCVIMVLIVQGISLYMIFRSARSTLKK